MTNLLNKILAFLPLLLLLTIIVMALSGCGASDLSSETTLKDLEEKYQNDCWTCQIFSTVYSAIDILISRLYVEMVDGARALLALIMGFWLLVNIGKLFFSFKEPDTNQFWTDFTKMTFAVIICGAFLAGSDYIFELLSWTVVPVFKTFINLALTIINSGFAGEYGAVVADCSQYMSAENEGAMGRLINHKGEEILFPLSFFRNNTGEALNCMIGMMNSRVAYGIVYSLKFMAEGGFTNILFGICFWVIFSVLSIIFPLYLIDGIFKIGIALVLVPLFIAFWPFKLLRPYVHAGIKMFLSTFFQILMMAIFITLAIEIMIETSHRFLGDYEGGRLTVNVAQVVNAVPRAFFVQDGTCESKIGYELSPDTAFTMNGKCYNILGDEVSNDQYRFIKVCGKEAEDYSGQSNGCAFKVVDKLVSYPMYFLFILFLGFYLIKMVGTTNNMAAQFAGAQPNSNIFSRAMAILSRMASLLTAAALTISGVGAVGGLGAASRAAMKKKK